jgi:uncharacterized protein YndB with AHSA1/START domain
MNDTKTAPLAALVVRRTFKAQPARVFDAMTQPELAAQWMCPGEMSAPKVELDVRVGGRYRIEMQRPDGEAWIVGGVYREVRAPERLAYTWKWEEDPGTPPGPETLVTIDLHDRGDATELVLTQTLFTSEESRDNHQHGWNASFDKLETVL